MIAVCHFASSGFMIMQQVISLAQCKVIFTWPPVKYAQEHTAQKLLRLMYTYLKCMKVGMSGHPLLIKVYVQNIFLKFVSWGVRIAGVHCTNVYAYYYIHGRAHTVSIFDYQIFNPCSLLIIWYSETDKCELIFYCISNTVEILQTGSYKPAL